MIEVFRTNVKNVSQAKKLVALLLQYFPGNKINFDLSDCDKVLRIEGENFIAAEVIMLVNEKGFTCDILE